MRTIRPAVMVAACLLLVAGCTGSHRPEGSTASPSSSVSPRDVGDRSAEALVKGDALLKATVHPIERAGDHVVLTVDYSFSKNPQNATTLDIIRLLSISGSTFRESAVRLLDLPGDRVWEVGRVGYRSASTQNDLSLTGQGQTVTVVTFFSPVDVDTVDVQIPKVGLVEDVPVVEGGSGTPGLASLGVDGEVVYAPPFGLESLVQGYQGDASATKQGDTQTVVMASDVLFASDSADLTDEAGARVDEVAAQIAQVASGGEVRVVGHTDDVASEEYNMDLSVRRATTVADRMAPVLGSSFTVVKEGKGKTEPAVEGTDPQARAANRRVEIEFTAQDAVALPETPIGIPEATGPVASGHDSVSYSIPESDWGNSNGPSYAAEVPSIVRRNGYLVGTLVISGVSGSTDNGSQVILGTSWDISGQREGDIWPESSKNVTLLGPQGRVFPTRYWKDNWAHVLGDVSIGYSLSPGDSVTYTVLWPDTGENSVTVDVPSRFRIADIPVEEG